MRLISENFWWLGNLDGGSLEISLHGRCAVHIESISDEFILDFGHNANRRNMRNQILSWSGARTPDNAGPVTCAVTRNDREDVADREGVADRADVPDRKQVADREGIANREEAVDIRVLEIETEIVFLEIENKDSFLLRVHSFLN
jgi:hypothetical protein